MTAASQRLFVSQPTISQAVAELESFYGVKLFDRLSKRLYITEIGKQLLSYARHITSLSEEMEQVVRNPDKSGVLRVGASLTIGACLLPQLINRFTHIYPFLKIQAVVRNTKDIEGLIAGNSIDFAVIEGNVHTHDIITRAFMNDELVLVCGKSHPLYKTGQISPYELEDLDFVVREPGSGTRELFESVMTANGINWKIVWECNGTDGIKNAVRSGIGVTVISKRLVESEVAEKELRIVKVRGLDFKRKFSIAYHKNKYIPESMKAFFNLCYEFSE